MINKNNKSKKDNKKIDKSLKIIKREKKRIKEEKKKIKLEKDKKFYNTKFGLFLKYIFDISENDINVSKTIREKLFYGISCALFGVFLCLIILFILSGGNNYLKLYYELSDFIDTYDTISNEYYNDVEKDVLVNNAIDSMINSVGDGYTTYTTEKDASEFYEDIEGTYNGIGCMVSMDDDSNIYVVEVFEDGPADRAGIQENDIILSIDGIDYVGKTSDEMASYVKNSTNDSIKFVVRRGDEEFEFEVVLEKVEIPSVASEIIDTDNKKIGYISVDIFSAVTDNQFEEKLSFLEKENIEGLIIDLRNNSGGYLEVVTDISSLFLEKGKVIYQLDSNGEKTEKIKDKTKEKRNYPIVVMVNGGSASASEIFAAAIKDSYGGYVVGTTTFGKGSVQKTKTLSNGGMIKYTTQKWLTPSGECIDGEGVTPTHVVEFIENETTNDSQLDYSVDLINSTN